MKKIIVSFAVTAALISSSSFAALNSYLQLKGSKGSSQVITCPDGTCTASGLAPDTYSISVVDVQGKPVSLDSVKYTCSIVSPRDSASGLPTGKRMHKPFEISKDMRAADLIVEQDESSLAIACSSSGGATPTPPVAADATAAKSTTYDLKAAKK